MRLPLLALLATLPAAHARMEVSCTAQNNYVTRSVRLVLKATPAAAGTITDPDAFAFWLNGKRIPAPDLKSVRVFTRRGVVHRLDVLERGILRDELGSFTRMTVFKELECPIRSQVKDAGGAQVKIYRNHGTPEGYYPEPSYLYCGCATLK
jgi:hypothetical protein